MQTTKNALVFCGLLGLAALASGQVNIPDPTVPGNSMNSAVRIVVTSDFMIDRHIRRWVRTHYPGWEPGQYEIQDLGSERYAIVRITADSKPTKQLYFRLISNQADPEAHEGGSFPF